jgi:hypothetical protein
MAEGKFGPQHPHTNLWPGPFNMGFMDNHNPIEYKYLNLRNSCKAGKVMVNADRYINNYRYYCT